MFKRLKDIDVMSLLGGVKMVTTKYYRWADTNSDSWMGIMAGMAFPGAI